MWASARKNSQEIQYKKDPKPGLVLFLCMLAGLMGFLTAGKPHVLAAAEVDAANIADSDSALSEYAIAIYLLEQGLTRHAIPHLETAWRKSLHDKTIGLKLAEAHFRTGNLGESETVLDELIAREEAGYSGFLLKAKIRYLKGQKESALEHLEKIRTTKGRSFEVERLLGRIYFELGRDEEALEAYGEAIRLSPGYPFIHYKYGLLLEKFNRREEAEAAFRDAIELEPEFTDAAMELAAMLMEDQRYDEAEAVLAGLFEAEGGNDEALLALANLYLQRGKLDHGIRLLEDANRRSALPRNALVLLGRFYYEAKNYGEALRIFEGISKEEQNSAELARIVAEISLKHGNPEKALEHFRRAIKIAPDDYRNYLALFFAASAKFSGSEKGNIELSKQEISRLVRAASARVAEDDFEAIYLLGISFESLDSLETARSFLSKAASLRPQDERALLNLASVLEKMKRYDEAEQHLSSLHELKPKDPTICNFYGYLLALMGKELDKAEALVKIALEQEPENGYYLDSLGWIYYVRGEYDKALIELEKASNIVKDDPIILEHLGDAYQSLKRYRQAIAAYEKSKDLRSDDEGINNKIRDVRRQIR